MVETNQLSSHALLYTNDSVNGLACEEHLWQDVLKRQTHQIRTVTGNIVASVQQPNYQGITDDLLTDILHK
jgi:23S rRNA maturation mini-RNase III